MKRRDLFRFVLSFAATAAAPSLARAVESGPKIVGPLDDPFAKLRTGNPEVLLQGIFLGDVLQSPITIEIGAPRDHVGNVLGLRTFGREREVEVMKVKSGFDGSDKIAGPVDATFFSTDCMYCPVDFGLFSDDKPLAMTIQGISPEPAIFNMVLVYQKVDLERLDPACVG